METIINFDDPLQRARMLQSVQSLRGTYRVVIARLRRGRTLNQNAWYWACIIPYVAGGLETAWGETLDKDQVHMFLRQKFLSRSVVNHHTGEVAGETCRSSAGLTVEEFTRYVEEVRKFAAESLGVDIPSPDNELMKK